MLILILVSVAKKFFCDLAVLRTCKWPLIACQGFYLLAITFYKNLLKRLDHAFFHIKTSCAVEESNSAEVLFY